MLRKVMAIADRQLLLMQLDKEITLQRTYLQVGDLARFYQSDEDFHRHIALFAGCGPVIEEIARVKVHMDRFRQLTVASVEDLAMVIAQHEAIRDSIAGTTTWQPRPACSCIYGGSSLFWSRPKPCSRTTFPSHNHEDCHLGQATRPRRRKPVLGCSTRLPVVGGHDGTGHPPPLAGWPHRQLSTAELPAALALNPQGDMAVVAFASGTALWTPTQGLLHWLTRPETDPQLRLNEGKCDPAGRFWVASMENNLDHHGQPRATSRFAGRLWRTSGEGHRLERSRIRLPQYHGLVARPALLLCWRQPTQCHLGVGLRHSIRRHQPAPCVATRRAGHSRWFGHG
jgi:hypothetical protein